MRLMNQGWLAGWLVGSAAVGSYQLTKLKVDQFFFPFIEPGPDKRGKDGRHHLPSDSWCESTKDIAKLPTSDDTLNACLIWLADADVWRHL